MIMVKSIATNGYDISQLLYGDSKIPTANYRVYQPHISS